MHMYFPHPRTAHRLATSLIGIVLALLVWSPPPAAAQSAPSLTVSAPADGTVLHSLDLTVSGSAPRGSGVLLCIAANGQTIRVYSTDADASTGAFKLSEHLLPFTDQYTLTVQALARPVPDQCVTGNPPGLASVTRTVSVATDAILKVEAPAEHAVLTSPQFTTTGTALRGSDPFAPSTQGVLLCIGRPGSAPVLVSFADADPTTGAFSLSQSLDQAGSPASAGTYTLIWRALPPPWPAVEAESCDPNEPGVPTVVRTITYTPDTTPPVISPNVSGTRGSNGWYVSDVTVSWSVTDLESPISSQSGCESTTINFDTPGTTVTCTATSLGGSATRSVLIKRDTRAPLLFVSLTPGTLPQSRPLITLVGTATVEDTAGNVVGSQYWTCFDTRGLGISLASADDASGSSIASLTYAATGAQKITSRTLTAPNVQLSITAPGVTTVTFDARDVAGLQDKSPFSESIVVGGGFACAGRTPNFSLPSHGTLLLAGTATAGGQTYPVSQTIPF